MHDTDILTIVHASAPRRWFGITVMAALGLLLVWIAFVRPPDEWGWQVFLLGFGGLSLYGAVVMHRVTQQVLELTREVLRVDDGTVLARIDNVQSVSRGSFAFKPSNGFTIRLKTADRAMWRPGLCWRFGRSLGIGGVLPGAQTKIMADMITAMLADPEY